MSNIQQHNTPGPNGADPIERAAQANEERESSRTQENAGGARSPQKQGPGPMQGDDDMKHRRGGGDVERDIPDQDEEGGTRQGGRSQPDMDEEETGGRSRPGPGRSRNM
jgi:hypothetical protein